MLFWILVIVGTSIWVYYDADKLGVKKDEKSKGFFNLGRGGWLVGCLLLWIVGFPAYLIKRVDYKKQFEFSKSKPTIDTASQ